MHAVSVDNETYPMIPIVSHHHESKVVRPRNHDSVDFQSYHGLSPPSDMITDISRQLKSGDKNENSTYCLLSINRANVDCCVLSTRCIDHRLKGQLKIFTSVVFLNTVMNTGLKKDCPGSLGLPLGTRC